MMLIEQINLQREFQSIIDSGYPCIFEIKDNFQRFTLNKPFSKFGTLRLPTSLTLTQNKFNESYSDFELFFEVFKEFKDIYNTIMTIPIKQSTIYLSEYKDRYVLVVTCLNIKNHI